MRRLTKEQAAFLKSHGFADPAGIVLNATGLTRAEFRQELRRQGKLIVYGVAPCKNGHTLRTSGGCPQCDTQFLAYVKRKLQPGYVYIAKSGTLTKVGFSRNPANRIYIANLEGYSELIG